MKEYHVHIRVSLANLDHLFHRDSVQDIPDHLKDEGFWYNKTKWQDVYDAERKMEWIQDIIEIPSKYCMNTNICQNFDEGSGMNDGTGESCTECIPGILDRFGL